MKEFLIQKNNVTVSTLISDLDPFRITTNGALTIVDNSDSSINGLVPNSYNIFLDNLFLASGYGFSTYSQYHGAAYVVSTYDGVCTYIINELDKLHRKTFNIEYKYNKSENAIDKVYNTYGWLKEYKEIDIYQKENDDHTYIFELTTVPTCYISDINMSFSDNTINLSNNYVPIGENVSVKLSFQKDIKYNHITDINKFASTSPEIYFENSLVDFTQLNSDNNIYYRYYDYSSNEYANKDLTIVCKRNSDIIYSYTFKNAIKWRYKILPFNTETLNALFEMDVNIMHTLDMYNFMDDNFDLQALNNDGSMTTFINFIDKHITDDSANNKSDDSIFLEDSTDIEYSGVGYLLEQYEYFLHDYFVICGAVELDFYFNGIKNNNWNYIEFNINGGTKTYRLYQSPQRYIGKHTWTIKYRHE